MIRIFMAMSGNLGDTLNVMPVLSGIHKSTGHKVSLVVRNKMKMFNGFKEFMEMQDCIAALKFESDVTIDDTYQLLSLTDNLKPDPVIPLETLRLEQDFKSKYNLEFELDNSFMFNVPEVEPITNKYLVGDRMVHPDMDQRRPMGVLEASGKFPLDKCHFLDYNNTIAYNAGLVYASPHPLLTTFTGISIIGDLLNKETLVLWDDTLKDWDNKHISYSYNKHFYRDRKSVLMHIDKFSIPDEDIS